ncbi:SDR family oxidoreductase [Rhodococcus sp. D2-41]|uniref:SDR family oxidoreductase n=1 Tax=Speluncibacter jeojiensis TaxID=2710754 RepID=A0A9X4RIW8_9ACTN|nr:SDR family oxidoreductase [Rhodococcus sp. D2-41]MDG3008914.1 SDR family oxidoreductase [Rhodococcus sp. D2-41]MDG3016536.1 SDR family oxidoreductase [Corynebacteriales bacterium D3-21]
MAEYIVTGGTGFLGHHVIPLLLQRDPDATVHVLVRRASIGKLERLGAERGGGDRVVALVGDLTAPGLGLEGPPPRADHVLHLGAVYDMTAPASRIRAANVLGTRSVIELALDLDATLHHVSSVAVAGDHRGRFTESDFDLGQRLPSPYHQTKFVAERLVRETPGLRRRIYRPAVVVGDSHTGAMDKIDGPYYFFTGISLLARLPHALPTPVPNIGDTNVVPVDYVAQALVELMLRPGLDGRTFHLVNPRPQSMREIYGALADAAGAPRALGSIPGALAAPAVRATTRPRLRPARRLVLGQVGIPDEVVDHLTFPTVFSSAQTERELAGTGIAVPTFASYARRLWEYWAAELDPNRARRPDPAGPLVGRIVLITGASSGIGRASALAVAERGATVLLLARRTAELDEAVAQIRERGGSAHGYTCDVTDQESVDTAVKSVLDEHGHVDFLVNNAGRSIRRSVGASTDRLHDYERTMAVNYFGAVRMVLALLPSMEQRRFGHIVNVSSIGVQGRGARFAAYIASKAALDAFSDCAATETVSAGVTFTNIHMPLTQTAMIESTTRYDRSPAARPETAAAMVVRALEQRPPRIDTPLGTLGEFGRFFTPRLNTWLLHQEYRAFPDLPAARRHDVSADEPPGTTTPPISAAAAPGEPTERSASTLDESGSRPTPPVGAAWPPSRRLTRRISRTAKRAAGHLPGIYW